MVSQMMPLFILDFSIHFPNISESDGDVDDSNIEPLRRSSLSWLPVVDVGLIFIIA